MTLLLNMLLGVIAFFVARYLFALVGMDGAVGWVLSLLVGLVVFFQDYASRLNHK